VSVTTEAFGDDEPRGGQPVQVGSTATAQRIREQTAARLGGELPDVDWAEIDQREYAALRTVQAANRRAWYDRTLPTRYADAHLGAITHEQDPNRRATQWLDGASPTLFLVGGTGVGKTYLAYAICNYAVGRGILVVAVTVSDLLEAMRPDGNDEIAERAERADLLLIDDFGGEKPSEWTVERLSALIDTRVREEGRQILTTNLAYKALVPRVGERTMSRLTGGATVVQMSGPDRRRTTW
jgi:DNA replication protein DnaC